MFCNKTFSRVLPTNWGISPFLINGKMTPGHKLCCRDANGIQSLNHGSARHRSYESNFNLGHEMGSSEHQFGMGKSTISAMSMMRTLHSPQKKTANCRIKSMQYI